MKNLDKKDAAAKDKVAHQEQTTEPYKAIAQALFILANTSETNLLSTKSNPNLQDEIGDLIANMVTETQALNPCDDLSLMERLVYRALEREGCFDNKRTIAALNRRASRLRIEQR